MLYIFHVDTGRMMTFEMNFTLESVQSLKQTIEQQHKIPASNQVLLISGGEMLQLNQCVGSYSAGTDTNPIFMFSTAIMDPRNPIEPWPSIDKEKDKKDSEHELKIQVDHCLDLPNTYQTVVARAQLSQQIYEMAKKEFSECEELVHEQHLQQQGWAAVVANMEDLTNEFRERNEDFYRHFNEYLQRRQEYIEFLTHFSDDLSKLANIPILPGLVHNAEERPFDAFNDVFKDAVDQYSKYDSSSSGNDKSDTSDTSVSCAKRKRMPSINVDGDVTFQVDGKTVAAYTLLHWILASENQKSLRDMAENCKVGLEKLNQGFLEDVKTDAQKHIDSAMREDMKEIKGLGDRLYGLERIMFDAKECVQEQNVLSQAFQQNQNRAANLGDTSILPDLCASHRGQLLVMVKNHKKLKDIRRRCAKCKDELGENIHKRLKYIVCLENKMSELDNKLLFYHRNIKRLLKHLGIIEQIHHAPCIYVTAVNEVVRRRIFSSAFLMWASNLACHLLTIHNDEVMRRQDFAATFEGHFLCTLFPGMDDMPPTYATEAPSIFDSSLPNLSESDIRELSHYLPELTSKVQLTDLGAVIEFFNSRSGHAGRNNSSSSDVKESSMTEDLKHRLPSTKPIDIHSHLKEFEKGFESETDTEEFEKLTQSPQQTSHQAAKPVIATTSAATSTNFPVTCSTSTSTEHVATQSTETLTEDNLGTTRLEVERLKNLLKTMYEVSHRSLALFKDQLANIKSQTDDDRQELHQQIEKLSRTYQTYNETIDSDTKCRERERVQQLTVDHELEMNDIKTTLLRKDDEIQTLQSDKSMMESKSSEDVVRHAREKVALDKSMDLLQERVGQLERQVAEAKQEREQAVKEMRENLLKEHKTEMESLRCKFRLMTNLERSPSDTSLEKIERPDVIDIASHELALSSLKQKFESEKDQAVRAAVERYMARSEYISRSSHISLSSPSRSPTTNPDLYKRILDEKERQLDQFREREEHLMKENRKFQDKIQALADSDITGSQISEVAEKLEIAQKEKHRLEQELEKEKRKRAKLTQNHVNAFVRGGTFTTTSCTEGANVLVVWNFHNEQYTVAQDSPVLYFLHSESYAGLNLSPSINLTDSQTPPVLYCLGVVETKEYCHAKRDENRYKVSKGTKFYRVKVLPRPMSSRSETERSCGHRKERKNSASEPVSRSMSTETCNPAGLLIDSFAQTEILVPLLEDSTTSRDMIDSGVQGVEQRMFYKERNISVTEEDEPTSLILDHLRCESVSEEITLTDVGNDEDGREPTSTLLLETSSDSATKMDDSDDFRSLEP